MRSPIFWYGGKFRQAQTLIPLFPRHRTYVEPFGGGGQLLCAKPPSPVEVYNDIDSGLYNFFCVLVDETLFRKFQTLVSLMPYSRQFYNEAKKKWDKLECKAEWAAYWFLVARQSFSGIFGNSWGYSRSKSNFNKSRSVSGWLSAIDMLPEVHARLRDVQIEHGSWERILDAYDSPDTFFYLDPPYLHETRKKGSHKMYRHEMTDADHERLLVRIRELEGKAMISGYAGGLYENYLHDWHRFDYQANCAAYGRIRGTGILGEGNHAVLKRTETIWLNYQHGTSHNGQMTLF